MQMIAPTCIAASCLLAIAGSLPAMAQGGSRGGPVVVSGAGNIDAVVARYRKLLGEPNNGNAKGPIPGGRREINWDGISDQLAAPAFLPGDHFKGRGALLTTPGKGIQASARPANPAGVLPGFGHINKTYAEIFKPYSGGRMFSPVGSNIVDLKFVVAGTSRPAVTRGFGAVYIDTDTVHTAFEYFDASGRSLGQFPVPTQNQGFSFLGVVFERPVVAHVRITYGTVALGPDDSPQNDVAVMDDFIFGEPVPAAGRR